MLRARAPFPMELTDEVFVLDGKKIPNPLRSFVLPERSSTMNFPAPFWPEPLSNLTRACDGLSMATAWTPHRVAVRAVDAAPGCPL
jgi:hypothetical protein